MNISQALCVFPSYLFISLKNANDVLRRPNKYQFEEQMLTKDVYEASEIRKKQA